MGEEMGIPKDFYSYDTGQPFQNCIQCGKDLIESGEPYLVERSIKRYPEMNHTDVIYEYAMCITCAEKQKEALSTESLQNIENYFREKMDPANIMDSFKDSAESGSCAIYGTPVNSMNEYVLQASFTGKNVTPGFVPMIFGEGAIAEMAELMSAKTKGEMDDFIDQHFSGPPEFRELIKSRKKVII